MTSPKKPEARWLSEDYPVVILHAHLSKDEAMKLAEHDIGDIELDYGKITSVTHGWVRYRKIGEDDLMCCEESVEAGDTVLWVVSEKETRPKGVVSQITIPTFEGWE